MLMALSFIAMALLLLTNCAQETIPDTPWEASLGSQGAVVFSTLSTNVAQRTYAQFLSDWDDLSNKEGPMICTRTSFFAQLKAFQETECNNDQNCTNMTPMQSSQFLQFMSNLKSANLIQTKIIKGK